MSKLARANGISDPDLVVSGTWLTVPSPGGSSTGSGSGTSTGTGGTTHTVRPGQTLSSIASRYGLSTSALAEANNISDPDLVFAGKVLRIPVAGGGSGATSGGSSYPAWTGSTSGLPSRLQNNPARLALMPLFDKWSNRYGVSPSLVKSVTWLESGWQTNVVSSTGAVGIGQLMPSTVVTVNDILGTNLSPWVPEENIRMSARYLALLMSATGGSVRKTLAGYYQGLASVARNGLYPSTIAYVDGVLALRGRFS